MKKYLWKILFAAYFICNTHSLLAQTPSLLLHQGSPAFEKSNSIALGTDKSIVFSGSITNGITLGANSLNNYYGNYISKYDSAGLNLWLIPAGNIPNFETAVAVDSNNDIYVLGQFDDTCHIGSVILTDTGTENTFIAKLNSAGGIIWAKKLTNNSALLTNIDVDRFGNILLTGMIQNTLYIDNDSLIPEEHDVVTIKLDNNGNLKWMKKAGGPPNLTFSERGYSISSDYNGNVYIGGILRSVNPSFDTIVIPIPAIISNGKSTGFIAKYDSSGSIVYAKECGQTTFSICSDSAGNAYACGYDGYDFRFDTIVIPTFSNSPAFVVSVSKTGNLQWAQLILSDYSNANAITSDNNGNCYVTGVGTDTTKIFGTSDTLILVNNLYSQPSRLVFVVGFDSTGNPFWSNLIKPNNSLGCGSLDIDYLNCQLAFAGYFRSPAIYYNNDSITCLGDHDGFVIVESDVCNYISSSIINLNFSEEINCFPNPFKNELTIKLNNSKLTEVIIYDMFSRKLLSQLFTNSTTLNTSQLAKGIYLYEVRNKNGVIKKGKVVKD